MGVVGDMSTWQDWLDALDDPAATALADPEVPLGHPSDYFDEEAYPADGGGYSYADDLYYREGVSPYDYDM